MALRKLSFEEMSAAAVVHRMAFDHRLPWLKGLHTPEEDRRYFSEQVFSTCSVWGAFEETQLCGFIAFRDGWIDQLYITPSHQSEGLGSALLHVAKSQGSIFRLWTFQRNQGARRFYEKRGFSLIAETDGQGNEEREPDALYEWTRR